MGTGAIKNLHVKLKSVVDEIESVKFYLLAGPARLHKQQIECTAYFDIERQSNWPVPFTNVENCKEVVYIDRDHMVRATEQPN